MYVECMFIQGWGHWVIVCTAHLGQALNRSPLAPALPRAKSQAQSSAAHSKHWQLLPPVFATTAQEHGPPTWFPLQHSP